MLDFLKKFKKNKTDNNDKVTEVVDNTPETDTEEKTLADTVAKIIDPAAADKKKTRDWYIKRVKDATGWKRSEVLADYKAAKEKYGITWRTYIGKELYNYDEEGRDQIIEAMKKKKENKKRSWTKKVMEATGWDYDYAVEQIETAIANTGCDYKDYCVFKFYELDEETQKSYYMKKYVLIMNKKYNTDKTKVSVFTEKAKFNEVFKDYVGRKWAHTPLESKEQFNELFGDCSKVIFKPVSASCGRGIQVYDFNDTPREQVYEELKDMEGGVVETYLIQHPLMAQFAPASVNTIRVVTVVKDDKVNIVYTLFRMGDGVSVVDNFHSGGVIAPVDKETGIISGSAVDFEQKKTDYHPGTGVKIKDFQIPYWPEVLALIDKAAKVVPGMRYIGWDVAITANGPVLIEANTTPSPYGIQSIYGVDKIGVGYLVEDYV